MPSLKTLTGSVDTGKIKGILLLVLILPPTLVHSGCVGLAGSSQVEYGTTNNYGLKTAFDPALVTNHAQTLTASIRKL